MPTFYMLNFIDYLRGGYVFVYITFVILTTVIVAYYILKKEADIKVDGSILSEFTTSRAPFFIVLIFAYMTCLWIVALPMNFGHRDEIALLTSIIPPTMYSGRFFPMGHMEFNIVSYSLVDGKLSLLYILPFLQLLIVLYLIDRIVSPANSFVRIFALGVSFALSLIIPFVNLIIPERNAIFFLVISIYLLKRYAETRSSKFAIISISSAALSLYYKEPMFALWMGAALGLLFYDFVSLIHFSRSEHKQVMPPKLFGSIQFGLFFSSILFLVGYYLFVFYNGAPESFYAGSGGISGLPKQISFFVLDAPLLSFLLFIAACSHFIIPSTDFNRSLIVSLCIGGVGYTLALIVLSMPLNGYYYSVPIIIAVICFSILINYFSKIFFKNSDQAITSKIKLGVFAISVTALLYFFTSLLNALHKPIFSNIAEKRNYHLEYSFLHSELKSLGDISSLYYAPRTTQYNDYATAIVMIFLHKKDIDHQFDIHSSSGCASWNESYNGGLIRCIKKDFSNDDNYDVLVIENDALKDFDLSLYDLSKLELPYKGYLDKNPNIAIAIAKKKPD